MEPVNWWLMLPEVPIAAILVLVAPLWAIYLLTNHHPVAAITLIVSVAGLGYAAYRAARANDKWGAYFSILGILLVAGLVASQT